MPRGSPKKAPQVPGRPPGDYGSVVGTQPTRVPASPAYGANTPLIEAQNQFPLPQSADPGLDAARGMTPPSETLLNMPTMRPNEPVTAGSISGPGPGPEVLNQGRVDPIAQVLRVIAESTGSPLAARLAGMIEG